MAPRLRERIYQTAVDVDVLTSKDYKLMRAVRLASLVLLGVTSLSLAAHQLSAIDPNFFNNLGTEIGKIFGQTSHVSAAENARIATTCNIPANTPSVPSESVLYPREFGTDASGCTYSGNFPPGMGFSHDVFVRPGHTGPFFRTDIALQPVTTFAPETGVAAANGRVEILGPNLQTGFMEIVSPDPANPTHFTVIDRFQGVSPAANLSRLMTTAGK